MSYDVLRVFSFSHRSFRKIKLRFCGAEVERTLQKGFSLGILVKCVLLDRYTASENTKVGAIAISLALKVKVT